MMYSMKVFVAIPLLLITAHLPLKTNEGKYPSKAIQAKLDASLLWGTARAIGEAIDDGADPNEFTDTVKVWSYGHYTTPTTSNPLLAVLIQERPLVLNVLLEKGADPNRLVNIYPIYPHNSNPSIRVPILWGALITYCEFNNWRCSFGDCCKKNPCWNAPITSSPVLRDRFCKFHPGCEDKYYCELPITIPLALQEMIETLLKHEKFVPSIHLDHHDPTFGSCQEIVKKYYPKNTKLIALLENSSEKIKTNPKN